MCTLLGAYFFYITNDDELSAEQVVFESNDRCNQENLIEQLKNGIRAFHAPVNTLLSNWAYMLMTSLEWSIKACMALTVPVHPRWRAKHEAQRRQWLRMDFRTFRPSCGPPCASARPEASAPRRPRSTSSGLRGAGLSRGPGHVP